uniref:peptidylprolyl isomerase n=1 Tax=Riptortus pedestris TaxID=329032 RepID=R4WDR3_RIPPE|nr:cyclophilin-6 [Riptortus pedestris]
MAVVIETTIGDITVDLFIEERPQTCKNFLKLCKIKYYNFCLFHSIQPNFIAQTGDPTGIGTGGESVFGLVYGEESKYYEAEKMPKIKHNKPGLLSMVNCGNNMLGSQFFVTLGAELKSLEEHCVFAEVTEGHDILIKLNDAICDNQHRPFQDIRITHTVILEDPFEDLPGLVIPDASPDISSIQTANGRIGADEKINDEEGLSEAQLQEIKADREAKARATILEIVGDLPHADVAPPENVLFVCKLNPVTTDEDLEVIFGRFGKVKSCEVIRDHQTGDSLQYAFIEFEDQKSCEQAYLKMDNVLIDDRRIHVDFSQSVSKIKWRGKGLGVQYFDKPDEKDGSSRSSDRHSNKRDYYRDRDRERERDRSERSDRRRDDDRRRRGTDRDEDYRRRERRKGEDPRRRDEESWREDDRWEDDRKRRDVREDRRRDDDRKYSSRRDERRREEDRRRDIEKRRNGTEKKETNSRRPENHIDDKKIEPAKNKDSIEKSPKQDLRSDHVKHNSGKQDNKVKEQDTVSNTNAITKSREEVSINTSESKMEAEDSNSKLTNNFDINLTENSTADTITPEKSTSSLKEKKKKRRKMSSSSESSSTESSESSSSSSSLDVKRKRKRKLTVAKKYYHRGKLVKVIKKKKDDSSDSESSDESSDSDHRRKKTKYKKIVKVIKKRRRTTTDDSDSDSSSSEDSDSSRPRKKRKKSDKNLKKKKKESKKSKKKKKVEASDDSSASEEIDKYKKKSKNSEAKKSRKEISD